MKVRLKMRNGNQCTRARSQGHLRGQQGGQGIKLGAGAMQAAGAARPLACLGSLPNPRGSLVQSCADSIAGTLAAQPWEMLGAHRL